jgi:ubiquitin carboxyl-terminal hydrolase 4/11/15
MKKEMNEQNLKLVLGHDSVKEKEEEETKEKSLRECLNLFTEKEDLSDQDNLYCNSCFKSTPNFKKYELERLPQMLIIVLKRFKYTKMYRSKIDAYIDFPLYDLDMSDYLIEKQSKSKYDLYGIIVSLVII